MNKQLYFGNSKGLVINDLGIKKKILDYLFNSLNLSNFRYKILKDFSNLNFLKSNKHYVTPNLKGNNYYLIFTSIEHKNYCVAIDKRKLSYHFDQIDVKNIFMIRLRVYVNDSIYRGTILDTKLIKKDNKYMMLIKDSYYLMGDSLLNMEMQTKIKHINSIINNQFKKECCNNFKFKINKLYVYDDLKNLINNIIPNCGIDCMGLTFYPKYSGINIIYLNKKKEYTNINSNVSAKTKSCNMISNLEKFLNGRTYSYELEGKKKKLWLSKTSITDVYNILENSEDKDKLGIAHIPNMKTSLMCQNEINDNSVLFNCIYYKKFKKWIPLSKV